MINTTQEQYLLIIQYEDKELGITLYEDKTKAINQIINGAVYNNSKNVEFFINLTLQIKDYYLSLPSKYDSNLIAELIIKKFPESKLRLENITQSGYINQHFNYDKAFYGIKNNQDHINQWFTYEYKFRFDGKNILREYNCIEYIVKVIQEKLIIQNFDVNSEFSNKLIKIVEMNELNLHANINEMLSSRWNIESI